MDNIQLIFANTHSCFEALYENIQQSEEKDFDSKNVIKIKWRAKARTILRQNSNVKDLVKCF